MFTIQIFYYFIDLFVGKIRRKKKTKERKYDTQMMKPNVSYSYTHTSKELKVWKLGQGKTRSIVSERGSYEGNWRTQQTNETNQEIRRHKIKKLN